jgi:hypothetical protein
MGVLDSGRNALLPADAGLEDRPKGDDLATRREEEFLRLAMLRRQRQMQDDKAAADRLRLRGVCGNCGAVSLAAYCDEDCRADDQARRAVQARQVRGVRS